MYLQPPRPIGIGPTSRPEHGVHSPPHVLCTAVHSTYTGPPSSFDHVQAARSASLHIIKQRYPELEDLVHRGDLVVVSRSALYKERRTDGYREPEEVFVVGTSHMSPTSADDVQRVIQAVRPDNVVVELCKSRSAVMYADDIISVQRNEAKKARNVFGLAGTSLPGAMQRSLQLGGQSALVLRLALAGVVRRVGRELEVQPGSEFLAARRAAEAVDAQLVLGAFHDTRCLIKQAWY